MNLVRGVGGVDKADLVWRSGDYRNLEAVSRSDGLSDGGDIVDVFVYEGGSDKNIRWRVGSETKLI